MHRIYELIFEFRSAVFALGYGGYILLFEDAIISQSSSGSTGSARNIALGMMIFAIQAFELVALHVKWRAIKSRLSVDKLNLLANILVWMFHAVVSVLLTFKAAEWCGLDLLSKARHAGPAGPLIFFAVVIKELSLLVPLLPLGDGARPKPMSRLVEFTADGVLLGYLCIVYSVIWKADAELARSSGSRGLDYVAQGVLFAMLYLPMVFAEIVEILSEWRKVSGKLKLTFAFGFPLICMYIDR